MVNRVLTLSLLQVPIKKPRTVCYAVRGVWVSGTALRVLGLLQRTTQREKVSVSAENVKAVC